jgi:hypothetical protein
LIREYPRALDLTRIAQMCRGEVHQAVHFEHTVPDKMLRRGYSGGIMIEVLPPI